jgi:hypothetical protein
VYKLRAYRDLVGKPEGRRPLGRPRRRWEDNIKIEFGLGGIDWINLAQDRDRSSSCECGYEPSDSTKCGEYLE